MEDSDLLSQAEWHHNLLSIDSCARQSIATRKGFGLVSALVRSEEVPSSGLLPLRVTYKTFVLDSISEWPAVPVCCVCKHYYHYRANRSIIEISDQIEHTEWQGEELA